MRVLFIMDGSDNRWLIFLFVGIVLCGVLAALVMGEYQSLLYMAVLFIIIALGVYFSKKKRD